MQPVILPPSPQCIRATFSAFSASLSASSEIGTRMLSYIWWSSEDVMEQVFALKRRSTAGFTPRELVQGG